MESRDDAAEFSAVADHSGRDDDGGSDAGGNDSDGNDTNGNDGGDDTGGGNETGGDDTGASADARATDSGLDLFPDDRVLGYLDENGQFVGVSVFDLRQTDPQPDEDTPKDMLALGDRATGSRGSSEYRLGGLEYMDIFFFAAQNNFYVTSTNTGTHNIGSAHYRGWAADIRTSDKTPAEVDAFINAATIHGFKVRDERVHPPGQRVWTGPHLHLENRPPDAASHFHLEGSRQRAEYHLIDIHFEEQSGPFNNETVPAAPTPSPPTPSPSASQETPPGPSIRIRLP